jgi:hypothetical protein
LKKTVFLMFNFCLKLYLRLNLYSLSVNLYALTVKIYALTFKYFTRPKIDLYIIYSRWY